MGVRIDRQEWKLERERTVCIHSGETFSDFLGTFSLFFASISAYQFSVPILEGPVRLGFEKKKKITLILATFRKNSHHACFLFVMHFCLV